jgi:glutamate carboxypeptidase
VYVTEPGLGHRGKIKTARKGTGEYVVYVQADAPGEEGRSLIVPKMMALVQVLHNLSDPERGITVNVGTLRGPGTNTDLQKEPARGSLGVDVRVVTEEDARIVDQMLRQRVNDLLNGTGVTADIQGGVERPPLERTPGNRRLWHAAVEIAHEMDLALEEDRAGGASDGNFTSPYAPTLDGLGAVGDGAHADHEFAYIDATVQRCALLALLLLVPVDS